MLRSLAACLALAALAAADAAPADQRPATGDQQPATSGQRSAAADPVARGKYLVTQVCMCSDCHSPRDQRGQFIMAKWLQGGPLTFKPTVPMPAWAEFALPIAGGGPWSDDALRTLLTTAQRADGSRPRPPMPAYELQREDADAVIAYLRSLR